MSISLQPAPSPGLSASRKARPPYGGLESPLTASMKLEGEGIQQEKSQPAALDAHTDARALVRLIQCPRCSLPYHQPVTLPCGNSLCQQCLPPAYERDATISWPALALRRQAIACPFEECGLEHPVADYSIDVILANVMSSISEAVTKHTTISADVPTMVEECVQWDEAASASGEEKVHLHSLTGGRLVATYTLASRGELPRNSDVRYPSDPAHEEAQRAADTAVLQDLIDSTSRELDCQVCYSIMLEPVTTFCGHTLCRRCMARVLDHSFHCPVCRRRMAIAPTFSGRESNKTLEALLNALCPELLAARAEGIANEAFGGNDGELTTPLFVCTLGFPNQPTFLRVFEPRYRLMLRRCLERDHRFGLLMYNRYREPQGELGPVHFYHYGTMLHIIQSQMLPDGTSLIETRGIYRFRVRAYGELDGYAIGNVERIDDVSLAEEERIEAEETSRPPAAPDDELGQIERMTTNQLLSLGRSFVTRMQERSVPFLQQRVLSIHGQLPDDAPLFPYWFASVLPISEEEKYKLLGTRTVRERLKITATWIRRIESQRWVPTFEYH